MGSGAGLRELRRRRGFAPGSSAPRVRGSSFQETAPPTPQAAHAHQGPARRVELAAARGLGDREDRGCWRTMERAAAARGVTGSPGPMVGHGASVPRLRHRPSPGIQRISPWASRSERSTRRVEAGGEGLPREGLPRGWQNVGGRARLLVSGLPFGGRPLRRGAGLLVGHALLSRSTTSDHSASPISAAQGRCHLRLQQLVTPELVVKPWVAASLHGLKVSGRAGYMGGSQEGPASDFAR